MLRDDAIWSGSQASASAAVAAGCAISDAPEGTAAPPLDGIVGDGASFPSNCESKEAEDGPGGLAAVCATLRAAGALLRLDPTRPLGHLPASPRFHPELSSSMPTLARNQAHSNHTAITQQSHSNRIAFAQQSHGNHPPSQAPAAGAQAADQPLLAGGRHAALAPRGAH